MSDIVIVPLRYDGKDAESHELNLDALGESLRGAARILAVVGNFAVTGNCAMQSRAMDVRVVAREPRANCFTLEAVLQFAQQQGLLQGVVAPIVAAIIGLVIAKASNNKAEMKHLAATVEKLIDAMTQSNIAQRDQVLAIVDRMTDALRPAAKQLVAPVGRSCRQMKVGDAVTIDEATAAAIRGQEDDEVDAMREYTIQITELDLENRTAKVRLDDESNKRVRAVISDPAINVAGNAYAIAFAAQKPIRVQAKAVLREGEIRSLYVSDTMGEHPPG